MWTNFSFSRRSLSLNYYGVDPLFVCLCLFSSVSLTFLKQDFIHENLIYHFSCHQNSIFSKLYRIYIIQYIVDRIRFYFIFYKIMESVDFYYNRTHGITRQASSLELKSPYQVPRQFEKQTLCTDASLENVYFVCCKNQLSCWSWECSTLYALKSTFILPLRMWCFVCSKNQLNVDQENLALRMF
jgi:hypothetical protein